MNKLMKKSSGIIVAICCGLMLGANVLTVYGANYKDSHWELTANPTGTTDTDRYYGIWSPDNLNGY